MKRPFVGSRPMKKLRVTLISGIMARSWKTVAMPASIASRGLSNCIGRPSKVIVPSVGLWTPDMVLMKVDFPAPLSPRRQWHSPGRTSKVTPFRAITLPKRFLMPCMWMIGSDISVPPSRACGWRC